MFCFVDNVVLIPNTDKPDVFISPTTFYDELIVVTLFNVVFPDTFNDDLHVVTLLSVVLPETFKVDTHVEGLLKLSNVGGFNIAL